jgi:Aerobic-type carbon monoxide dehydrogenase, large subunit CoxL/CutL homologs
MAITTTLLRLTVNGTAYAVDAPPMRRLSQVLREDLHLTGTKVGCNAGTCGACTVLIDGRPVAACLLPVAQAEGRSIVTIEGLSARELSAQGLSAVQRAFHRHGAAQCGMCTSGMLMAATALLERNPHPSEQEVRDALGGVLCRCTGYAKIIDAVVHAHALSTAEATPAAGASVGARVARLDGIGKVDGSERFGDDVAPADALWLRLIRSPYASAGFSIGDTQPLFRRYPGLVRILTAADVPGEPLFGISPAFRDQPVYAADRVRFQGEPIAAIVGDATTIEAFDPAEFPVDWRDLPPLPTIEAATTADAPLLFEDRPGNVLTQGRVCHGDAAAAMGEAAHVVEGRFETSFVEHAYIEPEAGYARRVGDTVEVHCTTQTPYANRADLARILGLDPAQVRVVPTAVGGGFGGKLDLTLQPHVALAAWLTGRPVRGVFSRGESMAGTTKRHPAQIEARLAADADGQLTAMTFRGDFNTGAYASWGPTVATRVPIHCSGPYRIPAVLAETRAIHTNNPPSGAFRGFGTPQAAIAREALMDALADRLDLDRLEFRWRNALRAGDATPTGQVLTESVGIAACLDALRPHWQAARTDATSANATSGPTRRGVGIACMWYGCGNTSLSNPSKIKLGLRRDGRFVLYQGAVDIGQGSNTVIAQIVADALGIDIADIDLVRADTKRTLDAGKTSASRQTFVSGKAAMQAASRLRQRILGLVDAGNSARLFPGDGRVIVGDGGGGRRVIDLAAMPADDDGLVLSAEGEFDPPTSTLDEDGQGKPYATYAFGAQMAEVAVDVELGTVHVLRIVAAHDVGRAINPMLVEGQVEGGILQGLGMALMEEFVPGRTSGLHDYLVPSIGEMPKMQTILIEDREALGPFGAKGVGEPALIPTAAAILNAIRDATGVTVHHVPATPSRLLALIKAHRHGASDADRG